MHKPIAVLAGALLTLALTAGAAEAKTIHLFSKSASQTFYDAQGNVVKDPNVQPTVGARFYAADVNYLGNHKKHAKKPISFDHISCLFTSIDPFATICDGQISLPGGMIFADHAVGGLGDQTTTFKITGGVGKYAKAKGGKIVSRSFSQSSDDSDLTITY